MSPDSVKTVGGLLWMLKMGDEARFLGILRIPHKVLPPVSTAASKSPPDSCIKSFEPSSPHNKKKQMLMHLLLFYGAGDEARTRYLHLGKVALYRMSYARNEQNAL